MTGPSLFDARAAREAKVEAQSRVEVNADDVWLADAYDAVVAVARRLPELTADDVWATGLLGTRENRALGVVMRQAARYGVIAKTDRVRPSIRTSRHGAPESVWRSLTYRGGNV